MSGTVRIDPDKVDRRIRMLKKHIMNPTLRPKRRAKMRQELEVLIKIQALYLKEVAAQIEQAKQKKLEEVAPELKSAAVEAEVAHDKAVAMLSTPFGAEIKQEEKEGESTDD